MEEVGGMRELARLLVTTRMGWAIIVVAVFVVGASTVLVVMTGLRV